MCSRCANWTGAGLGARGSGLGGGAFLLYYDAQTTVMEWLPGEPLMSRDNLASLQVDNIASGVLPGLEELGIRASSLPAIAPSYLRPGARDPLLALRRQSGPL